MFPNFKYFNIEVWQSLANISLKVFHLKLVLCMYSQHLLSCPSSRLLTHAISFHSWLFLPCNQYLPQLLSCILPNFPLHYNSLQSSTTAVLISTTCCPVLCQTHYRDPNTFLNRWMQLIFWFLIHFFLLYYITFVIFIIRICIFNGKSTGHYLDSFGQVPKAIWFLYM